MGILPLTPPTASVVVCRCVSGVRRCCSLTRRPPRSAPQLPLLRRRWRFAERNEFFTRSWFSPRRSRPISLLRPTSPPLSALKNNTALLRRQTAEHLAARRGRLLRSSRRAPSSRKRRRVMELLRVGRGRTTGKCLPSSVAGSWDFQGERERERESVRRGRGVFLLLAPSLPPLALPFPPSKQRGRRRGKPTLIA